MGKYHRTLQPGMNMLIPLVDKVMVGLCIGLHWTVKVRYVHSLKEIPLDIPGQSVSTLDNVPVLLEAILVNTHNKITYFK